MQMLCRQVLVVQFPHQPWARLLQQGHAHHLKFDGNQACLSHLPLQAHLLHSHGHKVRLGPWRCLPWLRLPHGDHRLAVFQILGRSLLHQLAGLTHPGAPCSNSRNNRHAVHHHIKDCLSTLQAFPAQTKVTSISHRQHRVLLVRED